MVKKLLKKSWINDIYIQFKIYKFKKFWRKNNKHNSTVANNVFNPNLVTVGKATYGELNVIQFANIHRLYIGNFVSIAQEVSFLLDAEHYTDHISTFPFKVKYLENEKEESFGKGDIYIDDDVWIGYRSTIMSGIHIGKGAIISAGAVVTKDVPPYAIVGGIPAKVIKYRFPSEICKSLENINYSKFTENLVKNNIEYFYKKIESNNDVDEILHQLQ